MLTRTRTPAIPNRIGNTPSTRFGRIHKVTISSGIECSVTCCFLMSSRMFFPNHPLSFLTYLPSSILDDVTPLKKGRSTYGGRSTLLYFQFKSITVTFMTSQPNNKDNV